MPFIFVVLSSKRKLRRKNRWSQGNLAKKKKTYQFNKENKAPEEQDEAESDGEEGLGNQDSSMEQSAVEVTQVSLEETERELSEQNANRSGHNLATEKECCDTLEQSQGCDGDLRGNSSEKESNGKWMASDVA